jgi:hypothetical protein
MTVQKSSLELADEFSQTYIKIAKAITAADLKISNYSLSAIALDIVANVNDFKREAPTPGHAPAG